MTAGHKIIAWEASWEQKAERVIFDNGRYYRERMKDGSLRPDLDPLNTPLALWEQVP